MNTVQDLRTALDRYADTVGAPDGARTVHDVETRVERARRRRQAGVVATLAAAALVVATVLGVRGFGPDSTPVPAQSPSPTGHRAAHPTYFLDHANGYELARVVNVPLSHRGSTPHKVHVRVPRSSSPIAVLKALGSTHDATFPTGKVAGPPIAKTSLKMASEGSPSTGSTPIWRRGTVPVGPTGTSFFERNSTPVQSGSKLTLWAVTTLKSPRKAIPVGVYTPVDWNAYPVGKPPFDHAPKPPEHFSANGFTADTAHRTTVRNHKNPNRTVTVRTTWPRSDQGVRMLLLPTTTGRFRITIDGHVQDCDSGRGPWCTFWDSDLSEAVNDLTMSDPKFMNHPHHTITVEAQGTTGSWRVMFVPGKGGNARNMTATAHPTR